MWGTVLVFGESIEREEDVLRVDLHRGRDEYLLSNLQCVRCTHERDRDRHRHRQRDRNRERERETVIGGDNLIQAPSTFILVRFASSTVLPCEIINTHEGEPQKKKKKREIPL
jgi:hypothetical protein